MSNTSTINEKAFKAYITEGNVRNTRTICLIGAFLYLIFIPVEMLLFSTSFADAAWLRLMPIVALSTGFVLSYQSFFPKYYDMIFSTIFLLVAVSIITSIYKYPIEDYVIKFSKPHLATILIYIMGIFTWSFFKLRVTSFLVIAIIFSYTFVEIDHGVATSDAVMSAIFILTASGFGFFSQRVRDIYLRQNFLLQQSLQESLDKKTIEAKDNAYLANHDPLTDLPNRRYATELLEKSLQVAKESHKNLVVMFIDLNGFKQINDVHGHAVGDAVLLKVARRLETALCRSTDTLSRLGGDEYLIGMLAEENSVSEIELLAEKITKVISRPMKVHGVKLDVGASIGMAAYPLHGNDIDTLIDIADQKMYQIKHDQSDRPKAELVAV